MGIQGERLGRGLWDGNPAADFVKKTPRNFRSVVESTLTRLYNHTLHNWVTRQNVPNSK
jgi:hypothetical protein